MVRRYASEGEDGRLGVTPMELWNLRCDLLNLGLISNPIRGVVMNPFVTYSFTKFLGHPKKVGWISSTGWVHH